MNEWEAIDRRIDMKTSPSPQVEVLRGIVDQVQPDGQTYSAFFGGSAVSWPQIYYGAVEAPQPGDQVTVHYRREDGYTEHLGVTGRPLTTADPVDLSGYVTDQELADHAGLPIHLNSYNTENTGATDAGHWSLIGSGQMNAQYNQLVATVLINGNGGKTLAFTRGTLRLRLRQQDAFPADPLVLMELQTPGSMSASDIVLVVTSNAGPTTYEIYARLTRDNEWLSFIPLWTEGLGTAHEWHGCGLFVSALPGGTQFPAAAAGSSTFSGDHADLSNVTATQHHTNVNDPTSGQKAALAGTSGTPGSGNKYVTDADTRLSGASGGTPAVVLGTAAAAGSSTTFLRDDDTIAAFDATAPSTQAFGDAAAAGSVAKAARRDHKHAMPSERAASSTTPAAVGTAAVGTGTTDARSDHVHAASGDTPSTQAFGDAAAAGSSAKAAQSDHKHGMPSERAASSSTPAAVGTAAVGTGTTDARADHVHATGAGTPTTQAFADAAAVGTGPAAAMTDHKHGWPALGTTAAAIGTSAGGSATTPSKSDHVHATGAGTPSTQAFGDAAAIGSGPAAAMTDHKHAMPALGTGSTKAPPGNDARHPTTGEKTWLTNGLAGQIAFPATQNPSSDPNTQDDYEEGTFTPGLAYATPGSSSWAVVTALAWYTKIGNRVLFHFNLQATPTNGSASGSLTMTGLPFTSSSTSSSGARFATEFGGYTNANYHWLVGNIPATSTLARFRGNGSGIAPADLAVGDIPTGGTVVAVGAGHYFV